MKLSDKTKYSIIVIMVFSSIVPSIYFFPILPSLSSNEYYPIFIYYDKDDIISAILKGSNYLRGLQNENGLFNISNLVFPMNETKVYSHSIIFETLLDIRTLDENVNSNVIDKAVNYLFLVQTNNSCWNFFYPIAPDSDDTSLALISLIKSNKSVNLQDSFTNLTLARLLSGHFNTWIYNNSHWNGTEDLMIEPAIEATILNALWLYNKTQYSGFINTGIELLENNQTSSGYWISNFWYIDGPYYTLYIINRIISLAKPNSSCLKKSFNFLIANQKSDGSWGRGKKGNPLDTALALLSLYYLSKVGYQDTNSIVQGILYLLDKQYQNGTWEPVTLWIENYYNNITYKKLEMTTSFAIKSLYYCLNFTSGWKQMFFIPPWLLFLSFK